eukprot:679932-Pleurochrysis_carterae.AAC.1
MPPNPSEESSPSSPAEVLLVPSCLLAATSLQSASASSSASSAGAVRDEVVSRDCNEIFSRTGFKPG